MNIYGCLSFSPPPAAFGRTFTQKGDSINYPQQATTLVYAQTGRIFEFKTVWRVGAMDGFAVFSISENYSICSGERLAASATPLLF
jgi:hypothetical protein